MSIHAFQSTSNTCLAMGVAFVGSYMAICYCCQNRLLNLGTFKSKTINQSGTFALMALSLGVVAIYSMNVLALSGLSLYEEMKNLPIHFEILPNLLGLISAILFSYIGLQVASRDKMYGKTKQQIVEVYVQDAKKLSLKQMKNISSFKMLLIISTNSLHYLIAGGIISGCGAAVTMCFILSSAKVSQLHMVWSPGIISLAFLFAWIVFTIVYWILFRLVSVYPHIEWLRVASSFLMALGIGCTHIVGMKGVSWHNGVEKSTFYNSPVSTQANSFSYTLVACSIFSFMLVIISFGELRFWLYDLSAKVKRYEDMHNVMKKDSKTADFIISYLHRHDPARSSVASRNRNSSIEGQSQSLLYPTLKFSFSGLVGSKRITPTSEIGSSDVNHNNRSRNVSMSESNNGGSFRMTVGGGVGIISGAITTRTSIVNLPDTIDEQQDGVISSATSIVLSPPIRHINNNMVSNEMKTDVNDGDFHGIMV